MSEKKFNLLSEPWIKVETLKGESQEVSLYDLFKNAHSYLCLAGETKHQDFSLLRLIEAILISVVYEDFENMIENPDDACRVWHEIYTSGEFPFKKIQEYLEKYQERFYLIHPYCPFAQVINPIKKTRTGKLQSEKVEKALVMGAKKLDGSYLESENKLRYFRHDESEKLTYSEAARWLLYMLNFDDNAVKAGKKTQGKSSAKMTGWLGCFTPVYLTGENLFKSIMFNLILCDRNQQLWDEPNPIWEREIDDSMSQWISIPNNLPELYTTYARRIWLEDSGDSITRFTSYPGEIFDYEKNDNKRSYINTEAETHMAYNKQRILDKQKGKRILYTPQKFVSERALWTYYANLCTETEDSSMPLVILWISRLNQEGLIDVDEIVSLVSLQTRYEGTMSGSVGELNSDDLTFHSGILDSLKPYNKETEVNGLDKDIQSDDPTFCKSKIIADEVRKLNRLRFYAGKLTTNLNYLRGSRKKDESGSDTIMEMLTEPFKNWLFQFTPKNQSELKASVKEWEETAETLAFKYLSEVERGTEPELLRLKTVEDGKIIRETNSAQIMNHFSNEILGLFSSKRMRHDKE